MTHTVLLRRSGRADEIGDAALFLGSDESSYMTGTDIVVVGGWFCSPHSWPLNGSHHMLGLFEEKEHVEAFLHHFR